jgi:hypothetical protein
MPARSYLINYNVFFIKLQYKNLLGMHDSQT